MQNEHDNLDKMDRWHSLPLDVHKWSDHPEIKALSERLYVETGIDKLDKSGNRKPKRTAKDMLRILLLDLYVNWLNDPQLSIGISRDTASFKVKNNRYNLLHISPVILDVQSRLLEAGYLETIPFYRDRSGRNPSYTTRIRHSSKLRAEFNQLLVDLHDIDFHVSKELILLREKYEDEEGKKSQLLDYTDTDYTNRVREQLRAYNDLLRRSFIDIPSLTEPFVRIPIDRGERKGKEVMVSIGPDNKHVHRVFNGTEEDNWTKGGRFYGGWWLQIPRDLRQSIYINDQPTVEVDYKALHPNLLLNDPVYDPYDLGELILSDVLPTLEEQRSAIKSLILMAINATSADKAFSAFRNDKKKGDPLRSIKNDQLQLLLDAFTDQYPELKTSLNTGKALELMNMDSMIANMVIDYFTQQNTPILCIHDSFIIQYDKEQELRRVLHDASVQIAGKGIEQDKKARERTIKAAIRPIKTKTKLLLKGAITIPDRIPPTEQYLTRLRKHHSWLERQPTTEQPDQ
ncbi:hypothetical protein MWN63_13570 [Paradonghicola geojensis]|nr:hypothetical protein [Marivivens geojensis]